MDLLLDEDAIDGLHISALHPVVRSAEDEVCSANARDEDHQFVLLLHHCGSTDEGEHRQDHESERYELEMYRIGVRGRRTCAMGGVEECMVPMLVREKVRW